MSRRLMLFARQLRAAVDQLECDSCAPDAATAARTEHT